MNITIFTSNQSRHLYLIDQLSMHADKIFVIQECNTIFPGKLKDFYNNTPIMTKYFDQVLRSEKNVFGDIHFLKPNVYQLAVKDGDLNSMHPNILSEALESNVFIVFGCSYIKGPLAELLVHRNAINIHMGIAPYYRGNSCNFWALHDNHPELVGATIMRLGYGLDEGEIICHCLPKPQKVDGFDLGMIAVKTAHDVLINKILHNTLWNKADFNFKKAKNLPFRYSKNSDFDENVVKKYLSAQYSKEEIYNKLKKRNLNDFINPIIL